MLRAVPAICFALFVAAAVVFLADEDAAGTQLLTNPGFEDGVHGWTPDELDLGTSSDAHSGSLAGEVSRAEGVPGFLAQQFPVQGGSRHEFSGWINANDPNLFYVWLRVTWYDSANSQISSIDSQFLVGAYDEYRYVSVEAISPPPAVRARAAVYVTPAGAYSFLVDDMAFDESPGPTPATAPPTQPPTSPATPTATSNSPAPSVTTAPTTTLTVSPTPSPRPPSPTPDEPQVFTTLTNGDFEQVRGDGTPYGWRKIGGTIGASDAPIANGQHSLALASEGTSSTKWAYQTVSVNAGQYYEALAQAWLTDADAESVFLRVSWYQSDDASGEAIDNADSPVANPSGHGVWRALSTGPLQAPEDARSARVRLMLRPAGEAEAVVYFDAVRFRATAAPTDAPETLTLTPTVRPTAIETVTNAPTATTAAAATQTSAPTVDVSPTPTPIAAPTTPASATPIPEPDVFAALTNGSFEVSRDDGTPYAWSKAGGEIAASDSAALDGSLGLELVSRTTSTKWAYQTVAVEPGAYYTASAWAMGLSGVDMAVIRVSWYANESGEGQALGSQDSEGLPAADGNFHFLSTHALQAPAEARAAKVRLLVRPTSASMAKAAFDGVTFGRVDAPVMGSEPNVSNSTTGPRRTVAPVAGGNSAIPVVAGVVATPAVLAERGPPVLANVRPAPFVVDAPEAAHSGDDDEVSLNDALMAALIIIPLLVIGGVFAQDLWSQSKRRED